MKERHLRLELVQDSAKDPRPRGGAMKGIGWNMADRARELDLQAGSLIDLVYRVRENEHPDFGGLEVEIAGIDHCNQQALHTADSAPPAE